MKTIIATLIISTLSLASFATENGNGDKIHEEYSSKEGVMAMSFSKSMIDAFDIDFDWQEAMKNFGGDFTKIRVLIISDEAEGNVNQDIYTKLLKYGYKEIDLEDDDADLIVFADKKRKKFNEIHLLSKGKDGGILISVYGNFEITDK